MDIGSGADLTRAIRAYRALLPCAVRRHSPVNEPVSALPPIADISWRQSHVRFVANSGHSAPSRFLRCSSASKLLENNRAFLHIGQSRGLARRRVSFHPIVYFEAGGRSRPLTRPFAMVSRCHIVVAEYSWIRRRDAAVRVSPCPRTSTPPTCRWRFAGEVGRRMRCASTLSSTRGSPS